MNRHDRHSQSRLLVACLAILLTVGFGQRVSAASPDETVRQLEQAQDKAAVAGDKRELQKIFAPDFMMVNPAGALTTRAQLFALLTGGTPPYRSATYETQLLRNLGNVIVTVGLETVVPNQGAQAGKIVRRRVMQVWKRHGHTWQLTMRQAMVMP